jgi:putative endonuclease
LIRGDAAIQGHRCDLRPLDCFVAPLLAMTPEPSVGWRFALGSLRMKHPAVYIMASRRNGTLYVGVTSDIGRRALQHRTGAVEGFTKRYSCTMFVRFEPYERMDKAIAREKQIKSGS